MNDNFYKLPVELVQDIIDPFSEPIWNDRVLSDTMIKHSIPVSQYYLNLSDNEREEWIIEKHAGRVKYLAEYGWDDPIILDVGVPVLNLFSKMVLDGNHRLAASIFRKDETILAELNGDVTPYLDYQVNLNEFSILMDKSISRMDC